METYTVGYIRKKEDGFFEHTEKIIDASSHQKAVDMVSKLDRGFHRLVRCAQH